MKRPIFFAFLLLSCSRPNPRITIKPTESWLGVYLAQEKIGYSVTKTEILANGYQFTNRTKMRLKLMAEAAEINSSFTCTTDTALILRNFDLDFVSKDRSFRAQGKLKGSKLEIQVKTGGEVKTNVLDVPEKLYPTSIIGKILAYQGLVSGKTYELKTFEPTLMNIANVRIFVEKQEKIQIKNRGYKAWRLNLSMLGLNSITWIDSTGETIKEESPPGILMIRETPEEALATETNCATLDVLSLFSIPVDSAIPEPRRITFLKIELTGIDTTNLSLNDEAQRVISIKPLILEVKTVPKPAQKFRLPIRTQKDFLQPSLWIQSDNVKIKDKARTIIEGCTDGGEAVQKLVFWVFDNIEKRATASLPSAVDVLTTLEGDCNEHSILFAALARAVGIPTKIVVGLVYLDHAFYYHAWNKVYLGKWISVDPTFGQYPADATHIKLQEGELTEQAKVLKIVGKTKIKIKEFK